MGSGRAETVRCSEASWRITRTRLPIDQTIPMHFQRDVFLSHFRQRKLRIKLGKRYEYGHQAKHGGVRRGRMRRGTCTVLSDAVRAGGCGYYVHEQCDIEHRTWRARAVCVRVFAGRSLGADG
ncbi:hypothetical protein BCEP4_390048 [Burkholderia cepacia]|nr:hypothetical protein BCEP4_390048 [Burkholderia cepacia]